MKKLFTNQRFLTICVLVMALLFLCVGLMTSHEIYMETAKTSNVDLFDIRADYALVENSTFGGVELFQGRLYFTYDPSKMDGKPVCNI